MSSKKKGYLGNQNLKESGQNIRFTKEQVEEYIKCSKDPTYFIEKYIKVVSLDEGLVPFKMYDYQEEMVNLVHNNRFIIAKLPRQSGKSTTMISYLLHYILFNQDMNVAVLANKQSVAKDILSRLQLTYEYLPLWIQQGIIEWNKGSIKLENGSKIIASSTSSSAIRGGSYNCIFLDEFAHVPTGIAEEFFNSVYPTITAGQDTKVLMVSTPNGLNMFYYYWKGATKKPGEDGRNEYIPIEVHWTQVPQYPGGPLRDEKWKNEIIANTNEQQFQQEFECDFVGSQNTLIESHKLRSLNWNKPIERNADGLWVYEEPKPEHSYFMTVDTSRGLGKDYSAFIVVDTTDMPYKIVAKYRNNTVSPMVFPTVIRAVGMKYNDANILVEINDIGGQVADVLHQDLEYENILMTTYKGRAGQSISAGFGRGNAQLGVRTTVPVKKLGCSILKSLIEEDKLIIEDVDIVNELITFVAKGKSFEADDGHTDDLVMSLVLFAWLTRQQYFKSLTDSDVRTQIYEEKIREIEDDLLPFGFAVNNDEEGEWDGEDRWFPM
tara:strand:+ start:89 stop:1735 length:1647 start_codon:yes stop_codon:yes gene_type:complete